MTSNLGSNLREQRRQVGFGAARSVEEQRDNTLQVIAEARASLPPELWNRIDEPLVFAPLSATEVANIARMLLNRVNDQLFKEQGVEIDFDRNVIDTLVATGGFDPDLGARPMRRMIQRYIEGPIANLLLSSAVSCGDRIVINSDGEELSFQAERPGSVKNKHPKKSVLG
jgi:ATP-dependent Clp protease ATP-binding subunit ClpC